MFRNNLVEFFVAHFTYVKKYPEMPENLIPRNPSVMEEFYKTALSNCS